MGKFKCKFFLNEWYANGKVCYCKACEVASKCVADIEQTEKMTGNNRFTWLMKILKNQKK